MKTMLFLILFAEAMTAAAQQPEPATASRNGYPRTTVSLKAGACSGLISSDFGSGISKISIFQAFKIRPAIGVQFDRYIRSEKFSVGGDFNLLWHEFDNFNFAFNGDNYVAANFKFVNIQTSIHVAWRPLKFLGIKGGLGAVWRIINGYSNEASGQFSYFGTGTFNHELSSGYNPPPPYSVNYYPINYYFHNFLWAPTIGMFIPGKKIGFEISLGTSFNSFINDEHYGNHLWFYQATLVFNL